MGSPRVISPEDNIVPKGGYTWYARRGLGKLPHIEWFCEQWTLTHAYRAQDRSIDSTAFRAWIKRVGPFKP